MGWVSVGLLLFSGGCVLYRHPPTAILQLVLGWRPSRSKSLSRKQSREEKDVPGLRGTEEGPSDTLPSINIPGINLSDDKPTFSESAKSVHKEPSHATISTNSGKAPIPTISEHDIQPRSPPKLKPSSLNSMPPPPRPASRTPLRPPPSAASSLRLPGVNSSLGTSLAPSRLTAGPEKPSRKVVLSPGHSPLDWAALTCDPKNRLRGKDAAAAASSSSHSLIHVRPSQLKQQNGRRGRDAWTEYQGKIYNITPYLPFHPGGEGELMRGAGRDSGKLFMEAHPWVNWEAMLSECLVGILVEEHEVQHRAFNAHTGSLDEMD